MFSKEPKYRHFAFNIRLPYDIAGEDTFFKQFPSPQRDILLMYTSRCKCLPLGFEPENRVLHTSALC